MQTFTQFIEQTQNSKVEGRGKGGGREGEGRWKGGGREMERRWKKA